MTTICVQATDTCFVLTERLLMGHKETNQTKQNKTCSLSTLIICYRYSIELAH